VLIQLLHSSGEYISVGFRVGMAVVGSRVGLGVGSSGVDSGACIGLGFRVGMDVV